MTEAVDPQAVVLDHIRRNPGADAVEIAEDNAMEPGRVARHLRDLKAAGRIKSRHLGRTTRFYPEDPQPVDDAVPLVSEVTPCPTCGKPRSEWGPDGITRQGDVEYCSMACWDSANPSPRCATCADDQCGDKGKDIIACDDHEPSAIRDKYRTPEPTKLSDLAKVLTDAEKEMAERDLAAMPDCESGTCTIGPPRDRIPYPYPESDREPVAVVQDLTTKYGRCTSTTTPPENWSAAKMDVTTSAGEHLTTQTFIPESKWRESEAKEDVEAWLHRELDALVRGAKERGLQASATVEWGTGGLRGDLTVQRGVRA